MTEYEDQKLCKRTIVELIDKYKFIYPPFFKEQSDDYSAHIIYKNLVLEKPDQELKLWYSDTVSLKKDVINFLKSLKKGEEENASDDENAGKMSVWYNAGNTISMWKKSAIEMPVWKKAAIAGGLVGGITTAVITAPIILPAIGFGQAGIAAGTYAASMMSSAAVANGGGIAAGSLVATLQSAGAAGLGAAGTAAAGAAGATAGVVTGATAGGLVDIRKHMKSDNSTEDIDENQ